MALSEQQVIEALRPVTDPELHVSIVELGHGPAGSISAAGGSPSPSP